MNACSLHLIACNLHPLENTHMSNERNDTKGTAMIVIVLSDVTRDEYEQAVTHLKSASAIVASAIGCEGGGVNQFMPQVFDPRDAIASHLEAMRAQADACECADAHMSVNASGGQA